ncbi:hypothetical protein PQQ84_10290 [Paraburkholderia strydomiana]|uniref:DUF6566 family protein n=1 Tax=Paraburkholderia strydomiana TaxID=1245417 RepID=UPI0038BC8933
MLAHTLGGTHGWHRFPQHGHRDAKRRHPACDASRRQIVVSAKQNDRGAWVAQIGASVDGKPFALPDVEPVTPEWTTQAEALRDGVERGCYLVDRSSAGRGLEDSAHGSGES